MSSQENRLTDVIIVDGPPGSGKSYISGHYIDNNPLTQHVSAGDLVRGIRSGVIESRYTPIVSDCLRKRVLLPDEIFGDIVLEGIEKNGRVKTLSLVDGFPQSEGDLERVQNRLNESGCRILGAICLNATLETSVARMAYRGIRDGEEVRRQHVFSEDSDELQYFRKRYLAHQRIREESLVGILESKNLKLEHIDVNPDILIEKHRVVIQEQFTRSVTHLISDN